MIRYEDECVGCSSIFHSCLGDGCPNKNVPHLYCDECEDEVDELYDYDGMHVCDYCLLKMVPKYDVENYHDYMQNQLTYAADMLSYS